jgi:hypothetical protein
MNIIRYRGTLLATMLLLTAVGLSCVEGPLEPVMPTTDTEFNIPILDQISTFADVAVQGPIVNNGNGTVSYISSQELKPMGVDSISVQPRSATEQVSIGQFSVAVPAMSDSLTATQMGFPPGTYPGGIPAGQTALAPRNLDMTDSIGYVAVGSGTLTLQVRNTLLIPIAFPNGLGIKNNSAVPFDNSAIGTFNFGLPISPGQTRTASVNLAGKIIRGQLQTDSIVFSTTGSGGSSVTVGATDGLFFSFSSTGLQADSAGARIPDQTIATYPPGSLFTVDDSVVIRTLA